MCNPDFRKRTMNGMKLKFKFITVMAMFLVMIMLAGCYPQGGDGQPSAGCGYSGGQQQCVCSYDTYGNYICRDSSGTTDAPQGGGGGCCQGCQGGETFDCSSKSRIVAGYQ